MEEALFKSGAVKHATQLTMTLEEIAKCIQIKYNGDVARMIKDVECLEFYFPEHLVPQVVTRIEIILMQEKLKRWNFTFGRRNMSLFITESLISLKKKKRVFPIILDHCLLSLRSQLKGCQEL